MNAPDQHAGKRGKCSKCGMMSNIPKPEPPVVLPPSKQAVIGDDGLWDTAAASMVLAGLACGLFAGCVPFAAVLGMAISGASLPVISRVTGTPSRVLAMLVMLTCLAWCGGITFFNAADSTITTLDKFQRQEAIRRQLEQTP